MIVIFDEDDDIRHPVGVVILNHSNIINSVVLNINHFNYYYCFIFITFSCNACIMFLGICNDDKS